MKPLVRRQQAVQATSTKFGGKPFAWGSIDCAKMAAFHLKQLGHKVRLAGVGNYKTAASATAALKRKGFSSLIEAADDLGMDRIPPAFALIGDLIAFPADHDIGAICIFAGNGNVIGFHEASDYLVTFTPTAEAMTDAIAWKAL